MPKAPSRRISEAGRVAALTRSRPTHDPDLVAARRNLAAAKLEEHIRKAVAGAPPLSAEQREELASLLRGGSAG